MCVYKKNKFFFGFPDLLRKRNVDRRTRAGWTAVWTSKATPTSPPPQLCQAGDKNLLVSMVYTKYFSDVRVTDHLPQTILSMSLWTKHALNQTVYIYEPSSTKVEMLKIVDACCGEWLYLVDKQKVNCLPPPPPHGQNKYWYKVLIIRICLCVLII